MGSQIQEAARVVLSHSVCTAAYLLKMLSTGVVLGSWMRVAAMVVLPDTVSWIYAMQPSRKQWCLLKSLSDMTRYRGNVGSWIMGAAMGMLPDSVCTAAYSPQVLSTGVQSHVILQGACRQQDQGDCYGCHT